MLEAIGPCFGVVWGAGAARKGQLLTRDAGWGSWVEELKKRMETERTEKPLGDESYPTSCGGGKMGEGGEGGGRVSVRREEGKRGVGQRGTVTRGP